MKFNLLILSFVFLIGGILNAQTLTFDYANANNWDFRNATPTGNNAGSQANLNQAINPPTITNPAANTANSICIRQGVVQFNTVDNGSNHYVSTEHDLGFTLSENWVVEFDFSPTAVNANEIATGAFIFVLADRSGNVFRAGTDQGGAAGKVGVPGQMISISFANTIGQTNYRIAPFAKWTDDLSNYYWGTTVGNDAVIELDGATTLSTTYRIRLERLGDVDYRLTVWRANETDPIDVKCFFLEENLTGLNHIQHSNITASSGDRMLTAELDNLIIQDQTVLDDDCCMPTQLLGPTSICQSIDNGYATFTVSGGGNNLTYEWNVSPNEVLFEDNGNILEVFDWGDLQGITDFVVSVDIFCGEGNCATYLGTLTHQVEVRPTLDAGFGIGAANGGSNSSTYDVVISNFNHPNESHTWELLVGEDCKYGAVTGITSNSSVNFSFTGITEYTPSAVLHTVSYADGRCPVSECEFTNSSRPAGNGVYLRTVSPNPSSGVVSINYEGERYENVHIIVRDVLGRKVLQQNVKNQDTQINIKEKGVFFIEIRNGDTLESTERVLIE